MANCAVIDPDGKVVGVIVADPATDKPYDGHQLIPVPAGLHVDHTWHHSHDKGFHLTDGEFNRRHSAPVIPDWGDTAQHYTFETPASYVVSVSEGRTIALMAARGQANFDLKNCGGYTWTKKRLEASDTCASLCAKMADDIKTKQFNYDWAVDWLIAQCTLLPTQLLKIVADALPAHQARLAKRYIAAQGVSI